MICYHIGMNTNTRHNNDLLQAAALKGDAKEVARLIPISDPKAEDSYALYLAVRGDFEECVRLLIPVSDCTTEENWVLSVAVMNRNIDIVKLLLPHTDPAFNHKCADRAAIYGLDEILALILPHCDPDPKHYSGAVTHCAREGFDGCLKLLLPYAQPDIIDKAHALGWMTQHCKVVDILYPLSNKNATLNMLKNIEECYIALQERISAEQSSILMNALPEKDTIAGKRKI